MQDQWEAAYPGIKGTIMKYTTLAMGRSPEQGCYSALYASLSPEVVEKGWNGVYLSDPVSPVLRGASRAVLMRDTGSAWR